MPTNSMAHGSVSATTCATRTPRPAGHQMLLGHHDGARFPGGAVDRGAIQRLDGIHVDDAGGDAFRFERLLRPDRLRHQQAVGDNRQVRPSVNCTDPPILNFWSGSVHDGRLGPPARRNTGPT